MPSRHIPQSNISRFRALKAIKDRKDKVPPPAIIPFTAGTITWFDTFYPVYKAAFLAVNSGLSGQSNLTNQITEEGTTAGYFVSDLIDALQNAIRRKTFPADVRALYQLPVGKPHRPNLRTDQDVLDWGERVHDGETARIVAGGAAITFPSLAEVDAAINAFKALNVNQAEAKDVYDIAQETLEALNAEADKLILKLWNEIETAFDAGNKPSMRRKAREWGVVYLQNTGEALSPDEFSIAGKVNIEGAGLTPAIGDAQITVLNTNTVVFSHANGEYEIGILPPGTYTLLAEKEGFIVKTITGVQVAQGAITTLNIQLAQAGVMQGTVTQGAMPANASVEIIGTGLTTNTDPLGNYHFEGLPAGNYTVRATITGSNPPLSQDQLTTVAGGETDVVNFMFP